MELLRGKVQEAEAKKDKACAEKEKAKSVKDKADADYLQFKRHLDELYWRHQQLNHGIWGYCGWRPDRINEATRELETDFQGRLRFSYANRPELRVQRGCGLQLPD